MVQKKSEKLTSIAEVARDWSVSEKTISNWVEFVFQAFDVVLPSNGDFPQWGVELLTLCAKHVSAKSSLYFAETGQKRRLKGTEFVARIRELRQQGLFKDFQQFQKTQKQQASTDEELEDELFAEASKISRAGADEIDDIKDIIEASEDRRTEALIDFIEDSPKRKKDKLLRALRQRQLLGSFDTDAMQPAFDVSFTEVVVLPAEVAEVPELLALSETMP